MARRKVHSKSRFGCELCKRRRVKCDERKPTCTACSSRDETCHYPQGFPQPPTRSCMSSNLATVRSTTTGSASPSPGHSAAADFRSSTRRRELELMHFWFTRTSQSFTSELTDLFQTDVVKAALEHEYLSDFILALASLHIASEASDPATVASYVEIALQYQSNAFPQFRTALENITESNCNGIVLCSIMSMVCSLVSPFLINEDERPKSSPAGCVLPLSHFIDGIGSIATIHRQWLQNGPYGIIAGARKRHQGQLSEKATIACSKLRCLNSVVITPSKPSLFRIYENAIRSMEESFLKAMGITWLFLAGKDFANELQKEDPMALTILMHWGVLLCELNDMWWAVFSGRRIAEEVYKMLNGQGDQWDEAKDWVRLELRL